MPQNCPQCHREAGDVASFCPNCGAALGASATTAQEAPSVTAPAPAAAAPAGATPNATDDAGIQVRRSPMVSSRPDHRDRDFGAFHLALLAVVQ